MTQSQLPPQYLPGRQVKDHGQVAIIPAKPQVGEILYPGSGPYHAGVALAVLGTSRITESSIRLERISGSRNLSWYRFTGLALLAGPRNDNPGYIPNTPGLLLAPAKLNS